jgi:hypothetical protein
MRTRRDFITLLGGAAAAWPLAAGAQQPAKAMIGFLDPRSPEAMAGRLTTFRQGLKETGYVEGENLAIEYRWGEGNNDRLPALAAGLVRQGVAVIATVGPPAAFAVKATTTTIPQVFIVAEDPVRLGLVASLARPGGNRTGINLLNSGVVTKRPELHRLPATYSQRETVEVGGLMSYGASLGDAFARQASKLELVINIQTARMQRDELAAVHSITTGSSAGLAPLRMRPA